MKWDKVIICFITCITIMNCLYMLTVGGGCQIHLDGSDIKFESKIENLKIPNNNHTGTLGWLCQEICFNNLSKTDDSEGKIIFDNKPNKIIPSAPH